MKYLVLIVLSFFLSNSAFSGKEKEITEKKDDSKLNSGALSSFKFRAVGPALTSGRVADIAINEKIPGTYYVASASGGVWKTENWGTTYEPIFDGEGSYSIGCIAIDRSSTIHFRNYGGAMELHCNFDLFGRHSGVSFVASIGTCLVRRISSTTSKQPWFFSSTCVGMDMFVVTSVS